MPGDASQENWEQHRAPLVGHCYRMLGSPFDADDAVQETMVRAWRSFDHFDGRSSLRTWLYRIATNVCLDALAARARRFSPVEEGVEGFAEGVLETRPHQHWVEPLPDVRVVAPDADPFERAALRQNLRLAVVAALQALPPRQRAALLLTEVLGWSIAEVAESLDTSVASVNSALQRARATAATPSLFATAVDAADESREVVDRYVAAFEAFDVDGLVSLLTRDAVLSMPPYTLWLRGPSEIRTWLLGRGSARFFSSRSLGGAATSKGWTRSLRDRRARGVGGATVSSRR